jgi:hypothetical protein
MVIYCAMIFGVGSLLEAKMGIPFPSTFNLQPIHAL